MCLSSSPTSKATRPEREAIEKEIAALPAAVPKPKLKEPLTLAKASGCNECNGTGYKGRIGLYEVMEVTDELRELIIIGASAIELRRKAIELGMITLRGSGLCKLRDGITTIEEVVKETVL